MLEIPESLTLARQLNETIKGKRIVVVETEHTKHGFAWYEGDPKEYDGKMSGKVVGNTFGIGSMVEMELDEYHFVVGDGVNVRYFPAEEKLPERYQTRITFEDGSSLIYSVQMYGAMLLIKPAEYENYYYWVGKEKPMPGTEDFNYEYFKTMRENIGGNLSVKAFLATEQRIPGLGNGVLQDILLEAGLHPKKKMGTIREAELRRLYDAVIQILAQMIEGSGRDTEKSLFGDAGRYRTKLSKKTLGSDCPYCGNTIQKATYLGGTIYFCSQCQIM